MRTLATRRRLHVTKGVLLAFIIGTLVALAFRVFWYAAQSALLDPPDWASMELMMWVSGWEVLLWPASFLLLVEDGSSKAEQSLTVWQCVAMLLNGASYALSYKLVRALAYRARGSRKASD